MEIHRNSMEIHCFEFRASNLLSEAQIYLTMRRFLIPIIIFAVITWGIWFATLNFSSPYLTINNLPAEALAKAGQQSTINNIRISFFLTTLFFAITLTLALILYFFYRFVGDYVDERQTMRRALRQSLFVSLGFITLALLQLIKTLNPLTFILTAAVVIALEFTFRATK